MKRRQPHHDKGGLEHAEPRLNRLDVEPCVAREGLAIEASACPPGDELEEPPTEQRSRASLDRGAGCRRRARACGAGAGAEKTTTTVAAVDEVLHDVEKVCALIFL